jgi:signal transduction histidine kinase
VSASTPAPAARAEAIIRRLRLQIVTAVANALGLSESALIAQLGGALNDAIRDHVRDLERRLERAERLAMVGQLSASVAHELRNPLSVIETSAFILGERGKNDERVQRHTRRIAEQVAIASGVVGDLLDAARGRPLETVPTDLAAIVRSAVAQVPCPSGACVEIDLPPEVPHVGVDERRMRQVLTNLATNALEATEGKGHVRISVDVEADNVIVHIDDDGPGIRPEHADHLFEPLFTTKAEGTGLGLALSRQIVRAHGGDILASNGPSGGARFDVRIPIARVEAQGGDRP